MTAIPLTSAALKGVKREIQRQYPELKSAHLTEAIASSLGFRTHAALLPRLDLRPADDPDYAYMDDETFLARAAELSGAAVSGFELAFADLENCGGINTFSNGAGRIDLTKSVRKRAWRNAMVSAINAGIDQRLFSIRPGDCRWDGWSEDRSITRGAAFPFSIGDIPALGYVSDAGFDELAIHVALWPTEDGKRLVAAYNAGFHAGDVFATGWLERRRGAWLQVGNDTGGGWTFSGRKNRVPVVADLQARPHGYAAAGSFMM